MVKEDSKLAIREKPEKYLDSSARRQIVVTMKEKKLLLYINLYLAGKVHSWKGDKFHRLFLHLSRIPRILLILHDVINKFDDPLEN